MRQFILVLNSLLFLSFPLLKAQVIVSPVPTPTQPTITDTLIQPHLGGRINAPVGNEVILNIPENSGIYINPEDLKLITYGVSGTVIDRLTARPVQNAKVYFENIDMEDTYRTTTSQSGQYKTFIPPGNYKISVLHNSYKQRKPYSVYIDSQDKQIEDIELAKKVWLRIHLLDDRNNRPVRGGKLICKQKGQLFSEINNQRGVIEMELFPGKYKFEFQHANFKISKSKSYQIVNPGDSEMMFRVVRKKEEKEFVLDLAMLKPQGFGYYYNEMEDWAVGIKKPKPNKNNSDKVIFYEYFKENFKGLTDGGVFSSLHKTSHGMANYKANLTIPDGGIIKNLSFTVTNDRSETPYVIEIIRKPRITGTEEPIANIAKYRLQRGRGTLQTEQIKFPTIDNKKYKYCISIYVLKSRYAQVNEIKIDYDHVVKDMR